MSTQPASPVWITIRIGIVVVTATLMIWLQISPGYENKTIFGTVIQTYGWPFVAYLKSSAVVNPQQRYFIPLICNLLITFALIGSVAIACLHRGRQSASNFQFGVSKLLWFTFLAALLLQLSRYEVLINDWANAILFQDNVHQYHYEHWGLTRPSWYFLAAIWIGLMSFFEVVSRLFLWIFGRYRETPQP